ncbi:hypothetical protein TRFO_01522 [Tritrichomonas foetus]|uniref:Uncharacterized protein n=1 Tax=Tritrichomonas foetus TaxID=1144522 RepID=A0A1J4JZB3_9EUKA|nr:hypothetical protein TRFO_01522 [Tritrichomonas foetus]|eukprot:OHT03824.1 hypothetical protein TRFO_01522 [Tritrichomonas foetus]
MISSIEDRLSEIRSRMKTGDIIINPYNDFRKRKNARQNALRKYEKSDDFNDSLRTIESSDETYSENVTNDIEKSYSSNEIQEIEIPINEIENEFNVNIMTNTKRKPRKNHQSEKDLIDQNEAEIVSSNLNENILLKNETPPNKRISRRKGPINSKQRRKKSIEKNLNQNLNEKVDDIEKKENENEKKAELNENDSLLNLNEIHEKKRFKNRKKTKNHPKKQTKESENEELNHSNKEINKENKEEINKVNKEEININSKNDVEKSNEQGIQDSNVKKSNLKKKNRNPEVHLNAPSEKSIDVSNNLTIPLRNRRKNLKSREQVKHVKKESSLSCERRSRSLELEPNEGEKRRQKSHRKTLISEYQQTESFFEKKNHQNLKKKINRNKIPPQIHKIENNCEKSMKLEFTPVELIIDQPLNRIKLNLVISDSISHSTLSKRFKNGKHQIDSNEKEEEENIRKVSKSSKSINSMKKIEVQHRKRNISQSNKEVINNSEIKNIIKRKKNSNKTRRKQNNSKETEEIPSNKEIESPETKFNSINKESNDNFQNNKQACEKVDIIGEFNSKIANNELIFNENKNVEQNNNLNKIHQEEKSNSPSNKNLNHDLNDNENRKDDQLIEHVGPNIGSIDSIILDTNIVNPIYDENDYEQPSNSFLNSRSSDSTESEKLSSVAKNYGVDSLANNPSNKYSQERTASLSKMPSQFPALNSNIM